MFELVQGDLETTGEMSAGGEKRVVEITVRSIRTTSFTEITGKVFMSVDGSRWGYDYRILLIRVANEGASVGELPAYRPRSPMGCSCY